MQSNNIWGLREEARECWDHFVSDKIIYLGETHEFNLDFPRFTEQYLNRNLWFELHLTSSCETHRESHFHAIWERANGLVLLPSGDVETNVNVVVGAGSASVFVECPEFIQLPEGVVPKRIASEIRLKPVQDSCYCGWKQSAPLVIRPRVGETGKTNTALFRRGKRARGIEMSELPRELIEAGSKAAKEVTKQHRDDLGCRCELNPKDMEQFFRICLFDNGIGFAPPRIDCPFKKVEMFVRPTGFHIHEYHGIEIGDWHNVAKQ
jgi:hypothetical protein